MVSVLALYFNDLSSSPTEEAHSFNSTYIAWIRWKLFLGQSIFLKSILEFKLLLEFAFSIVGTVGRWLPSISSNLGRPREMRLPLFACYRFRSCVSMRRWNNNCAAAKRIFKIKHCATYSRLHNNLGPIPSSFLQEASASLRLNIALPTVGCIIVWDQFLQAFCKKQLSWTSKLWPGYT